MSAAGEYRFRVRFDVQVETPDPAGGSTYDWSTLENGSIERWASIEYLRGGETVMGQRLTGIQPALIRVILDTSTLQITPAWRAVLGTRAFALKSVADMEGKRAELTILAEAGAADA